jgi:hypothetical protein
MSYRSETMVEWLKNIGKINSQFDDCNFASSCHPLKLLAAFLPG